MITFHDESTYCRLDQTPDLHYKVYFGAPTVLFFEEQKRILCK